MSLYLMRPLTITSSEVFIKYPSFHAFYPGGGLLGLIVAGYVSLASQNYPHYSLFGG